jgi:hypothetical protein
MTNVAHSFQITRESSLVRHYDLPFAIERSEVPSYSGSQLLNLLREHDEYFVTEVTASGITVRLPESETLTNQQACERIFAEVEELLEKACQAAREHDEAARLVIALDLI